MKVNNLLLDSDIKELLKNKHIYLSGNGYPQVWLNKKTVTIHKLVTGKCPKGLQVDHINRNKLDNRRSNLRFVTPHENLLNRTCTSKTNYCYAYYEQLRKKWKAYVYIKDKKTRKHVGYFVTEAECRDAFIRLGFYDEHYETI